MLQSFKHFTSIHTPAALFLKHWSHWSMLIYRFKNNFILSILDSWDGKLLWITAENIFFYRCCIYCRKLLTGFLSVLGSVDSLQCGHYVCDDTHFLDHNFIIWPYCTYAIFILSSYSLSIRQKVCYIYSPSFL